MAHAWADSTLETYGAGLLAFHIFCDKYQILEESRTPANTDLMLSFVSTLAGIYSGLAIRNYVSGVRAWHILHRLSWDLDQLAMDTIIKGVTSIAPASSKRPLRQPVTIATLLTIRENLNLQDGRDAAIWACATCLFYGVARLGELTTKTLTSFDAATQVKRTNVSTQLDRNGLEVTAIFVPHTKAALDGESICFAVHLDRTDPVAALQHHFELNNPSIASGNAAEHLFTHTFKHSRVPLSRNVFLNRLKGLGHIIQQDTFTGHSFRIGGTLEYLLRGVPFETVKYMGRWASDAFKLYLRKHAQ
ncbi:hypothetical protein EUX98_g9406, partial [Antrodiella citrinella]